MPKFDFETGSSTLGGFYGWINERHRIYLKRAAGEPKPWTEDEIFLDYKFTNAFRQLDRGTVALRKMLEPHLQGDLGLLIFNIMWYRSFNLDVHAENLGFIVHYEELQDYIEKRYKHGSKIFTSAHMTCGLPGEPKAASFLGAIFYMWEDRDEVAQECRESKSMEVVFRRLKEFITVGPFVSYEMVCDFRFTPALQDATDILTWSNTGPGAKRGLRRLGLQADDKPLLEHMEWLYHPKQKFKHLEKHVLQHDAEWCCSEESRLDPVLPRGATINPVYPPFELREIEHSLCEFDKYERVRLGHGAPRQRYKGRA